MPRPTPFLTLILALFCFEHLPLTLGQPFALLSWMRVGDPSSTYPVVYTKDGGRTFTDATAGGGSFHYGLSSPSGGATITFSRGTSGVFSMQQWNPITSAWVTYVPGFPSTVTSIYAGDMNINRAAWVGVEDSVAGFQMYAWSSGGIPFVLKPAAASSYCAGYKLGAIGSLPSLGALAAMAVPPYYVSLWTGAGGCGGVVDLVGGTTAQVWSIASTSTVTPYSITAYSVLVASGPIGCGGGAACPSAVAGGRLYTIKITAAAPDSAMLTASNWGSFAAPNGGGVNLVGCIFTVAPTLPTYCYAAATWSPPVYTGACTASTTGYAFYTSGNSDPTLSSSWAEVGCAPLIAQAMVVVDYTTIHLSGFPLGGGNGASGVVAYWSSTRGATWVQLTALPTSLTSASPSGTAAAVGLRVMAMAPGSGGPVLLSGMDPSLHCQITLATNYYYSTSTCVKAALLATPNCNSVLKMADVALGSAKRGDPTSVAILGTFMPSSSSTPQQGNSFFGWAWTSCYGWDTRFYSNHYASTAQSRGGGTIDAFFAALMAGTTRPSLIIVAEVAKSVNGIWQADQSVIDTYSLALARFISTGGGLYVLGFQGPFDGTSAEVWDSSPVYSPPSNVNLNFGFLASLTPGLVTKTVSGNSPAVTAAGTANFPTLASGDIASPWHTSFGGGGYGTCTGCTFGVLSCLAYETLSGVDECSLVGGASIAFNYGAQAQTITCTALGGPYTGYYRRQGLPVYCSTTSGLPLTLASTTPSACTFSPASFPGTYSTGFVNASSDAGGACTLQVTQPGDSVYAPAAAVTLGVQFNPCTSPSGSYCGGSNGGTNTLCPIGTNTSGVGGVGLEACRPCPPGTYAGTPGTLWCTLCPPLTYCPNPGATSPTPCNASYLEQSACLGSGLVVLPSLSPSASLSLSPSTKPSPTVSPSLCRTATPSLTPTHSPTTGGGGGGGGGGSASPFLPSLTPSSCPSASHSPSPSLSTSTTGSESPSPFPSLTHTVSPSHSTSPTGPAPSRTSTLSSTPSSSDGHTTNSPSPSDSPSASPTPSSTSSPTLSPSPDHPTPSPTLSNSPTPPYSTPSPPPTPSLSSTPSGSSSMDTTLTPSPSPTLTTSLSPSLSTTTTSTPSSTLSPPLSLTPLLATPSPTHPTFSPRPTPSPAAAATQSPSPSALLTAPPTGTATGTTTGTRSQWRTSSPSPTAAAGSSGGGGTSTTTSSTVSPTPSSTPYQLTFDLALPGGTTDMIVGTSLGTQLLAALSSVALAAVSSVTSTFSTSSSSSGYNVTLNQGVNSTTATSGNSTTISSSFPSSISDWLPSLTSVQQYTSSDVGSTGKLMASSSSSSSSGSSAGGIGQSNLTASLASSGLTLASSWVPSQGRRQRRLDVAQAGNSSFSNSSFSSSVSANSSTTGTNSTSVCSGRELVPASTNNSTVLRVGVAVKPPSSVTAALLAAGISGAELAVLVASNLVSPTSPNLQLAAFQSAMGNCTHSNYSALLLGSVGVVAVVAGGSSGSSGSGGQPTPLNLPLLLGLLGGLLLLGLLLTCLCCWWWLLAVGRRKGAAPAALTIAYEAPHMLPQALALKAALRGGWGWGEWRRRGDGGKGVTMAAGDSLHHHHHPRQPISAAPLLPVGATTLAHLPKGPHHPVLFLLHVGAEREEGAALVSAVAEGVAAALLLNTSSPLDTRQAPQHQPHHQHLHAPPLQGLYFMVRAAKCSSPTCRCNSIVSSSSSSSSSNTACSGGGYTSTPPSDASTQGTPSFFLTTMLLSMGATKVAPMHLEALGSRTRRRGSEWGVEEMAEWVRGAMALVAGVVAEGESAVTLFTSTTPTPPSPPSPAPAPVPVQAPASPPSSPHALLHSPSTSPSSSSSFSSSSPTSPSSSLASPLFPSPHHPPPRDYQEGIYLSLSMGGCQTRDVCSPSSTPNTTTTPHGRTTLGAPPFPPPFPPSSLPLPPLLGGGGASGVEASPPGTATGARTTTPPVTPEALLSTPPPPPAAAAAAFSATSPSLPAAAAVALSSSPLGSYHRVSRGMSSPSPKPLARSPPFQPFRATSPYSPLSPPSPSSSLSPRGSAASPSRDAAAALVRPRTSGSSRRGGPPVHIDVRGGGGGRGAATSPPRAKLAATAPSVNID